jgi:hypothetical protein
MPEPRPNTTPILAMVMFVSALTLVAVAVMIYTGVVPVGEEVRLLGSVVVGVAAFADFLVATWFFRKSQSGAPSTRSVRDGVESS